MSSEDNDGVGMTILKGLGKLLLNVMDETAKSAMKSGDSKRMETASKYMANRQNIAGKWEAAKQREEARRQRCEAAMQREEERRRQWEASRQSGDDDED